MSAERGDDGHDENESAVDCLSRETRAATEAPPVDWAAVEAKLFARVKADTEEKRRRAAHPMWLPIAGVLAAAAAVALLVGRASDTPMIESPTAQAEPVAGSIVAREGDGEVLIDGHKATTGTTVGAHAVVETLGGARALIERAGKVSFWIEPASRLVVTRTAGTLVLALDRGAVEAKVTPVDQGEAFAVDVGASRVAVHGTHFRVARDGSRAVVDLTEGVVSIGVPPRTGSTYGELVTAPAHAEFATENAAATLHVDHAPTAVRPAVAFAIPVAVAAPTPTVALAPTTTGTTPSPLPPAPVVASAPLPGKPDPATSAQAPAAPQQDPHAETTIARAVRACLASRPPARGVKLTVSTVIELKLRDDGTIELAQFDPPLAPDAQACATSAIYRVRFVRGGAVAIPIDYQYGE